MILKFDPEQRDKKYELRIEKEGRQAFVLMPFDARKAFAQPKGTLLMTGTLNGTEYRSRLMSLGEGRQVMFMTGEMMKRAGCTVGDVVQVTFEPVQEEEAVEAPAQIECSGMDTLTAIFTRGSVRRYTAEAVGEQALNTVLSAGFCAPCASGKRPAHFVVIQDREKLNTLADGSPFTKMLTTAPVAVVVCGDRMRQGSEELLTEDCAAAAQNMLLAAHAIGLGAVWCGVRRRSSFETVIASTLKLPHKVLPIAVLAMGHPDEHKEQPVRFVQSRVHREEW